MSIEKILDDSLKGDFNATSIVSEAATESESLYEFVAQYVPININEENYNDLLTPEKKEILTKSAVKFYSEIIKYIKRLESN